MYEYETSKTKLRLTQFLKKIGSNNNQFVVKMGYAPSFLNSKSGISEDRLTEIAIAYPNLNMNWLLTGDGEMLKNISENSENNLKQTISEERNTESTNENQDVPMSEILEFMKLVSSNMDSQLKSFHLQMSEQRVEMKEQRSIKVTLKLFSPLLSKFSTSVDSAIFNTSPSLSCTNGRFSIPKS